MVRLDLIWLIPLAVWSLGISGGVRAAAAANPPVVRGLVESTPTDTPADTPTSTPTNTPLDTPTATPTDTPADTPTATPTDTPADTPTATPTDTPADTPTTTPTDTPADTPTATPTDTPADTPTATPTDTPADTPTATPTDSSTPTQTSTPTATPTSTFGVRGRIRYYRGDRPVAGAQVDLLGMPLESTMSDEDGFYALPEVAAEMRTLQPKKTGDFDEGISSLDGALVKQIVVGLETADEFQALAADVTGNGAISSLDAARIIQFQLGIITKFAVANTCGSDWVFVPDPSPASNQTLVQPQIASGTCQPGAIQFDPLVTPVDAQDFIAVLFGDCTGNWMPSTP